MVLVGKRGFWAPLVREEFFGLWENVKSAGERKMIINFHLLRGVFFVKLLSFSLASLCP
jgi:hypothetical protein